MEESFEANKVFTVDEECNMKTEEDYYILV